MREIIRDPGRLRHILEAIEHILQYMDGISYEELEKDLLRTHAVAYNIQIIGEASYKLTKDFKEAHSETPWNLIEKMRHILVHDYFAVDLEFVWEVIRDDIPTLHQQVTEYLKEFEK